MKAVTKAINKRVKIDASELELEEKLLAIDRVTKVVKGGRKLRFRALLVIGDGKGHVGVGLAKATGVPEAIRKASVVGRKELIEVPIVKDTIPHEILAKFGASKVLLKPAALGNGMIASNTVRAVLELAGIKDIISKSLGSSNRVNVARATILALASLKSPKTTVTGTDLETLEEEANETE
ncbi:MAG: 30S ribosomal protein S5 [Dehalococcoidia bacterium]|nr:30S ribosomal protein S5 [Dehalococcoidia bacterium]